MAVSHGSLPFPEQIDFFRGKVNLSTRAWTDVYTVGHDWAFVVAGAMKQSLLADLRSSVEKPISKGLTLEQFLINSAPRIYFEHCGPMVASTFLIVPTLRRGNASLDAPASTQNSVWTASVETLSVTGLLPRGRFDASTWEPSEPGCTRPKTPYAEPATD